MAVTFRDTKRFKKEHRKKILKQIAIERCPNTKKITLKTADALLIAIYGVEAHLSYQRALPWVEPTLEKKVAYSE